MKKKFQLKDLDYKIAEELKTEPMSKGDAKNLQLKEIIQQQGA